MSGFPRTIVYALMLLLGLAAMYAILNAGNPQSLIRPILADPAHDIYVALGLSLTVFILGFVVFYTRDREGFQHLVRMNADTVRAFRKQGHSDPQIADSILAAMGSRSGYRHHFARKKLIFYLSEFE